MADIAESPKTSVPSLRRKSIAQRKSIHAVLSENDDEAERISRRNHSTSLTTRTAGSERRQSLGLSFIGQMSSPMIVERMNQCIKLSTQNKITTKNAFQLELIDFMTYMIKKQDTETINLQVASASLDASVKIYGFRVDSVYTDMLKVVGGLEKQHKDAESEANITEDQEGNAENAEADAAKALKKRAKKKRAKQNIFSTVEALKGTIETCNLLFAKRENRDQQTSDTLSQVTLPIHVNSEIYEHQYNDVIFDTIDGNDTEPDASLYVPIPFNHCSADIANLEICPSFANFQFDDSDEFNQSDSEKEFSDCESSPAHCNIDANISNEHVSDGNNVAPPPFVLDDNSQACISFSGINEDCENVNMCARQPTRAENIVDFRKLLAAPGSEKPLEYSFIPIDRMIHWTGPSHWKLRSFKNPLVGSRVVEKCPQEPVKKRKKIVLTYDNETKEAAKAKFAKSGQALRLNSKTTLMEWQECKITLPEDVHYKTEQLDKLVHHPLININCNNENLDATHISDDAVEYNYNNDNDVHEYCPNVNNEDYGESEVNADIENGCAFDNETSGAQALAGNNLIPAPKMANVVPIQYTLRAKKIDMRKLRQAIWTLLISDNKENESARKVVEQQNTSKIKSAKYFNDIYKDLPKMLSKSQVEGLNFSIAVVALFHLANEKSLNIESVSDGADLLIESD